VTVIVGLKCQVGIVLASDSQTTFGDSKRRDAEKIRVVKFRNFDKALVAQSGSVETSSRIIDVMGRLAAEREIEGEESVIKTLQDAMCTVRVELRKQHFDCPAEKFRDIIFAEGLDCSLMVAHFYDHQPFIHVVKFQGGTVRTAQSDYESEGCGSSLANYLLGELCTPKMDANFAKALAVYVVDKTIQNVNYFDKPIRLAVLWPWKPTHIEPMQSPLTKRPIQIPDLDNVDVMSIEGVKEIEDKVTKIDEETKQGRIAKLRDALFSYAGTFPKIPDVADPNLADYYE